MLGIVYFDFRWQPVPRADHLMVLFATVPLSSSISAQPVSILVVKEFVKIFTSVVKL